MALGYYLHEEHLLADGKCVAFLRDKIIICEELDATEFFEEVSWGVDEKGYPTLNRVNSDEDVFCYYSSFHYHKKKNVFHKAGIKFPGCGCWAYVGQDIKIVHHFYQQNPSINNILSYKNADLAIQYLKERGLDNLTIAK